MDVNGERYEVNYWPGDSKSGMFGGNSNWRGPICEQHLYYHAACFITELTTHSGLAVNFILIESLQRFYQFYGDEVQVSRQKLSYTSRLLTNSEG